MNKGYRPDPTAKRTQPRYGAGRNLRVANLPPSFSLEQFCHKPILDQNNCGSCTGHGTAQALVVAFAAKGDPLSFCPSPRGIYDITRCIERADITPQGATLPTLGDTGGMPSDIMRAISSWGVRPMTSPSPQGFNSDCDLSNVNDEPNLDELEQGAELIVTGEHRVDETAPDVVQQVCHAIAVDNAPVGLGCFVDTLFEEWTPGHPLDGINLDDPNGGGHWLCIVGYRTGSDGRKIFRLVNSWSATWGENGFIDVTETWLKKSASDLYAFAVARMS